VIRIRCGRVRALSIGAAVSLLVGDGAVLAGQAIAPAGGAAVVAVGESVVPLNGPWRFHTGDDRRWADPAADDAGWEIVDLTPAIGAHDPDVGLTGYVDGWGLRGHSGYSGFAWYRLRVIVRAPAGESLAIAGPLEVNDAYELYVDGRRIGGSGDFSGSEPVAFNTRPAEFRIPPDRGAAGAEGGQAMTIALRVWVSRGSASASPTDGGVRIAPAIGTAAGIAARHEHEWLAKFLGYVVDVAEPVTFLLLAGIACSLLAFPPHDVAYGWVALALVVLGANRANHALFYWTQVETEQTADVVQSVLLIPLTLGAWVMAWRVWFGRSAPGWTGKGIAVLTVLYMAAEVLSRPWWPDVLPRSVGVASAHASAAIRAGFLLVMLLIVVRGVRRGGKDAWLAVPAVVLLGAGLFAQELGVLKIPGIWFPFGVGVSRTQFAYVGFGVALFALLAHRLLGIARRQCAEPSLPRIVVSYPTSAAG
jgi:hypothetical protein